MIEVTEVREAYPNLYRDKDVFVVEVRERETEILMQTERFDSLIDAVKFMEKFNFHGE